MRERDSEREREGEREGETERERDSLSLNPLSSGQQDTYEKTGNNNNTVEVSDTPSPR